MHFGGLDIVINNAGISVRVPIDDDGYDEAWTRGLSVMLTAHQRVIRAALPYLRQSKSPWIVNIASTEVLGATVLPARFGGEGRRRRDRPARSRWNSAATASP